MAQFVGIKIWISDPPLVLQNLAHLSRCPQFALPNCNIFSLLNYFTYTAKIPQRQTDLQICS